MGKHRRCATGTCGDHWCAPGQERFSTPRPAVRSRSAACGPPPCPPMCADFHACTSHRAVCQGEQRLPGVRGETVRRPANDLHSMEGSPRPPQGVLRIAKCCGSRRMMSAKPIAVGPPQMVFAEVALGAIVLTINCILLGGEIVFFQSVCLLGYCLFPLVVAAIVCASTTNKAGRLAGVGVAPWSLVGFDTWCLHVAARAGSTQTLVPASWPRSGSAALYPWAACSGRPWPLFPSSETQCRRGKLPRRAVRAPCHAVLPNRATHA
jgi:hypothetical protein